MLLLHSEVKSDAVVSATSNCNAMHNMSNCGRKLTAAQSTYLLLLCSKAADDKRTAASCNLEGFVDDFAKCCCMSLHTCALCLMSTQQHQIFEELYEAEV